MGPLDALDLHNYFLQGQGKADPKEIESLVNTLSEKLDGYEVILSKQLYLAGENMTLADLFVSIDARVGHLPPRQNYKC